jgi:hypothetical protein
MAKVRRERIHAEMKDYIGEHKTLMGKKRILYIMYSFKALGDSNI